jgi:hypothetical protein
LLLDTILPCEWGRESCKLEDFGLGIYLLGKPI